MARGWPKAAAAAAAAAEPLPELDLAGASRRAEIHVINPAMFEHEHGGVIDVLGHAGEGEFARGPRPGGGRAAGNLAIQPGPDSGGDNRYYAGDEHDTSSTKANNHAQRQSPLPVAGIIAASAAVTGLAAGTAPSPAAAFGLFALLLAGLSLVILHVRRA